MIETIAPLHISYLANPSHAARETFISVKISFPKSRERCVVKRYAFLFVMLNQEYIGNVLHGAMVFCQFLTKSGGSKARPGLTTNIFSLQYRYVQ